MLPVTVRAPAKINLVLEVGAGRPDGFHALSTVYHAVSLYDEVTATPHDDAVLAVRVLDADSLRERTDVPRDESNLAIRAADRLRSHLGRPELGADLLIHKGIPVAGGMAGGSADAAATLVACNEAWQGGLSRAELEPIAAELGSDVPFLLHGSTAVGTGRGEQIAPVLARGHFHWVLATFAEGMSTPEVYEEHDRLGGRSGTFGEATQHVLEALRDGDPEVLGGALVNDLADAALALRPELAGVLALGLEAGAVGGLVSGSGPTLAFLVRDEIAADDLAEILRGAEVADVVLTAAGPRPGAKVVR
ncbi:4-(cytidine 5'-diphospho)-2-C-methyl-D-erythritol kinase [Aeromicrobium sp. YIM 150415]|uniref:4-diphosphocytidyl-2-C-methyl-D-erythritol kinase n=1 Tax=Aeromicrobium piscarium TaxID=2590901 RepID=A0A554S7J5_9ACTN|nr:MULTISPECIES: 4-(cytidine 5'-diphospho)-2-C-methyl-D-erythritol kinase [Aeromicrobium]MBM9461984.1 4-(cytidine 5'-diphospho)-2-C-methyl-D-erythritol kinase [Aeromicrobium sp. YIM 150415]TSD62320.1 4-(cytidine 5'-diphospho)-2-C-methyl-D-erythritol kinase [Aeromicrobium piscarium]